MLDVSITEGLKALRPLIEDAAAEARTAATGIEEPDLPPGQARNLREPIAAGAG